MEIGHGMGIDHHREGLKEPTTNTVEGGVFDCAMRYTTQAEYDHPELLKAQTRYCTKGETWKKTVETTDADGNKTVTYQDMPSDNCFGQIDIKSDP